MASSDRRGDRLYIRDEVGDEVIILIRPLDTTGWDATGWVLEDEQDDLGWLAPDTVVGVSDGIERARFILPASQSAAAGRGRFYFSIYREGETLARRSILDLENRV